jgi:16S rRNA (guanine527-N7)-methyltransferase
LTAGVELGPTARTLLGIELDRRQLHAFRTYADELLEWNERFNLTAITDRAEIETKHFLDSLTCLLAMNKPPKGSLIDVGSGAGFPGLPVKIACPGLKVTLVEATGKKAEFCQHIIRRLGLKDVEAVHGRAEDLSREEQRRQAYDWAVARAVARLPVLVEYLLPFLRIGGRAIALKGETGPAEAHHAEGAIRLLGGRVERVLPVELPGVVETRYVVRVHKIAATPLEYPRRAGIPGKRPLS